MSLAYPFGIDSVNLRNRDRIYGICYLGLVLLKIRHLTKQLIFPRTHFFTLSKVRRNPFQHPFSLKINASFLITQHGGSGACGGMRRSFRHFRHSATCRFYISRVSVFFEKSFRVPKVLQRATVTSASIHAMRHPMMLMGLRMEFVTYH